MDYLPGFNDYMAALFADLYWWQGRQLEAAPGLKDCVCPVTLIDGGTFYHRGPVRVSPDCRYHRVAAQTMLRWAPTVEPPCTCRYGVWKIDGAPGPWALIPEPARRYSRRWGTRAFRIDPACPHHGDRGELDDPPAWVVLDDQERRGD
jgi:hypothetical protein